MKRGISLKLQSFDAITGEFTFKQENEELVYVILQNDKPILTAEEVMRGIEEGYCVYQLAKSLQHIFIYYVMEDQGAEVQAILTRK